MLFPIAKDVKVQVEFNPTTVAEYRLIGYETRALRREDFNNDKVDAGEIGSGHAVTAIYELTPAAASAASDPLRYQQAKAEVRPAASQNDQELTFLKIRYKLPDEETSRLIELPVRVADAVSVEQASADVRFSTAVAAFGQLLRGEPHLGSFGYDDVIALANAAKGDDPFGYRAEFVSLVRLAKSARP
jgi:Ca-activated chloride channel family protein